jgi:pilus assembly protein Flp/PilA
MKIYRNREIAQGLVEYALIIVLIAIVVIVAMNLLAPQIGNVFSDVGDVLDTV